MRRFALLLLGLPALSACAGGSGWSNPAYSPSRTSADLTACRRDADEDMGPSAYIPPGEERTGNPMTLYDRDRNAKQYEALVAACMAGKGYRRTE